MGKSFFLGASIFQLIIITLIGYTLVSLYRSIKKNFKALRHTKYELLVWPFCALAGAFLTWAFIRQLFK